MGQAVIFVFEHDEHGSSGLILNRSTNLKLGKVRCSWLHRGSASRDTLARLAMDTCQHGCHMMSAGRWQEGRAAVPARAQASRLMG